MAEEIEVVPLNSKLLGDDNASSHLVTRREQRDVVDYAFKVSREKLSKRRLIVAVRGSPGIGKSWSGLLYIRKLMQQTTGRRPIIFERGTGIRRRTVLVMPETGDGGDEKWVVYHLQGKELPSEWFDCGIIDLVVDPAHFGKDEIPTKSPMLEARGHIFIPVYPDDRHLGGSYKDASLLLQLVLGPWSLKELEVAFPYMLFDNPSEVYAQNRQVYVDAIKTMRENYPVLGGLPRYLVQDKANTRKGEVTPKKASVHSQALLDALADGQDFSDKSTDKILTRFFTLRAGEDENGYNPDRLYSTLDFVSPGATKAAGKIILDKIHKDYHWRNMSDASDIGLAFERVALIFLSQGTEGMRKLGIRTRCRQLSRESKTKRTNEEANDEADDGAKEPPLVSFVLHEKSEKIEQAPNKAAFEEEVRASGKGMTYDMTGSEEQLESRKTLSLPPDGYSNVDGMVGSDLGTNATLQKNHSVSGPEYIRQRQAFGLGWDDIFALVFVVPPERFDSGWTSFQQFHWADDDEGSMNRKRRKVAARTKTTPQSHRITPADQKRARDSMRQFVLTLEIIE